MTFAKTLEKLPKTCLSEKFFYLLIVDNNKYLVIFDFQKKKLKFSYFKIYLTILQIDFRISGPAFRFTIDSKSMDHPIDVDLVVGFEFKKESPPGFEKIATMLRDCSNPHKLENNNYKTDEIQR